MTWDQAVAHCIRKWRGAEGKTLKRYNASKGREALIYFESGKLFKFDTQTCALCVKTGLERQNCEPCPLYQARGGYACSETSPHEITAPYLEFKDEGDSTMMLQWLQETKRFLKTKKWKQIEAKNK